MPVPCLCTVVTCNVDVSEHYELGIPLPMFYYGRPAQQMLCYIFALWFLLCIFFPRLILAVADWMSTIPLQMVWPQTCCTRLAENTGCKNRQKFEIWEPSHNFVRLYLCNWGTYRQSGKNLLNSSISLTYPYNMVNFGLRAAEIGSLVWAS